MSPNRVLGPYRARNRTSGPGGSPLVRPGVTLLELLVETADLAVTSNDDRTVCILNGNGAGGFTPGQVISTPDDRPEGILAADFDGDGSLSLFDFLAFQSAFDAMDPRADIDGDGAFTVFDFLDFQNLFAAGCP